MTGTLLPIPRLGITTSAGSLLHVYVAGTSTLATTYSDSGLTTPNTDPVVADGDGLFPAIYVGLGSFKLVLQDAGGSTLFTQDNVQSVGQLVAQTTLNAICDGRLTVQSATPVSTSDSTSASILYFTPYRGNRIALYDGSAWNISTFSEVSTSIASDAANTNFDVFAYLSGGALLLERVAWASDSARVTALTTQDGVLVKSGSPTKRYLGTYRTTATIGQTADAPSQRFVWNANNRVRRGLRRVDTTDTWTYTTATFRQANNAAANKVEVVIGVAESMIELHVRGNATNATGANVAVGIGEDSISTAMTGSTMQDSYSNSATLFAMPSGGAVRQPTAGYHYYAWLEYSGAAGTTTWYGDNGVAVLQTGIFGQVDA